MLRRTSAPETASLQEPFRDGLSGYGFICEGTSSLTDPNHKPYRKIMIPRLFFIVKLINKAEEERIVY